jgi:hypothetical protein
MWFGKEPTTPLLLTFIHGWCVGAGELELFHQIIKSLQTMKNLLSTEPPDNHVTFSEALSEAIKRTKHT